MMPHEMIHCYCLKCKKSVDDFEVKKDMASGYLAYVFVKCHGETDRQQINLLNIGSARGIDGLIEFFEADPEPVIEEDVNLAAYDVWYNLCGKMVRFHNFPLTRSEAYDRVTKLQKNFEWDDAQADQKIKVAYHNPWGSFPVFPDHPELQAIYELYVRLPPDQMPNDITNKGGFSDSYDLFWRGCLVKAYRHGKSGGKCDGSINPLGMAHAAWLAGRHAGGHDD